MMYTTQTQAVQQIEATLKNAGLDHSNYDVLTIADEYHQETNGYDNIDQNSEMVLSIAEDHVL